MANSRRMHARCIHASLRLFAVHKNRLAPLLTLADRLSQFLTDGWNLLDLVVVSVSLVGLAPVGLPVPLVLSLRAIRVVRLFGKVWQHRFFFLLTATSVYGYELQCLRLRVPFPGLRLRFTIRQRQAETEVRTFGLDVP
jgi:hypothetical protein